MLLRQFGLDSERVEHEAGVDMTAYPAISSWLARVESREGFVNDLEPYPENAHAPS